MHIHTVYLHIPCLHAYLQQIHACMHAYLHIYIIIIIIRQLLCPVVGQSPQHSVSKLPCLVLSSAISCRSSICPCRLSTAWLVSLVVFSCHMVSKWWHARSIGRLWGGWYALPRTISFFSQCWLYLWPLPSPWHRCWSFYLCMWCWAYFFPFWSVRPLVCSVLVCSVSRSLHHMSELAAHRSCTPVSSGRWQGCFWRYHGVWRMPPSLRWFFVVSLCPGSFPIGCIVVPSTRSLGHFLWAHYWRLEGCLSTTINFVFSMFILRPIRLLSSDSSCSICCSSCGISVHMNNMSSAKRRLERNFPSIFTPLFSQFKLLNRLSNVVQQVSYLADVPQVEVRSAA